MRLMRTASSPSLISISAMPDSSRSSISFFIFLMSMPLMPSGKTGNCENARPLRGARESRRGRAHRRLVAAGSEAGDHTDADVRDIGMPAKRLAGDDVGQVALADG